MNMSVLSFVQLPAVPCQSFHTGSPQFGVQGYCDQHLLAHSSCPRLPRWHWKLLSGCQGAERDQTRSRASGSSCPAGFAPCVKKLGQGWEGTPQEAGFLYVERRGQGVVEEDSGPFLYMDCSLLGRHHGYMPEREKYNSLILKEHKGVT